MPTAVTIDRYAEIRAEMEAGALRDEVLARAGLSIDEWTAAQRQWLESMGAEIERGRFELTNRYSQAFLAHQRALTAARAPVIAAPVAAVPIVEAAPRPAAKPSFLAAGAAAEPPAPSVPVVRPPSPLLSGTMSVDVSAFRPALPFDPNAPPAAPPPAAPPAPAVKRAPAALSGTSLGQVMPKAPALPFAASAAPAADKASAQEPSRETPVSAPEMAKPVVNRAPAALSGTSMAFVAPKGPALPFAPGDAPASPPAPPAPSLPVVKRAPAALSGTSMGLVTPKGPALPFAKESGNPAPPPPDTTVAAKPPVAPEAPPGGLSLEQYASLCVELGLDPGKAVETFRRYGLSPEQGQLVDVYWKQRVGADPAARAAFDRAYGAYRAWLEAARGATRPPT